MSAFAAVLALGCGSAAAVGAQSDSAAPKPRFEYQPTKSSLADLAATFAEAKRQKLNDLFIDGPELTTGSARHALITKLWWNENRLRLIYDHDSGAPQAIDYATLPAIGVIQDSMLMVPHWGVPVGGDWVIWCNVDGASLMQACARNIANMLFYFKLRQAGVREADRLFAAILAKYPDPASRPPLPEEARKFVIQAEYAVQRRD